MRKLILPAIAIFSSISIFSCTKVEDVRAKSDELLDGEWQVTSYKGLAYDSINNKDSILPQVFLPNCKLDNKMKFDQGHSGRVILKGDQCNTHEVPEKVFDWEFRENEQKFHLYNVEYIFDEPNMRFEIMKWSDGEIYLRHKLPNNMVGFSDTILVSTVLSRR